MAEIESTSRVTNVAIVTYKDVTKRFMYYDVADLKHQMATMTGDNLVSEASLKVDSTDDDGVHTYVLEDADDGAVLEKSEEESILFVGPREPGFGADLDNPVAFLNLDTLELDFNRKSDLTKISVPAHKEQTIPNRTSVIETGPLKLRDPSVSVVNFGGDLMITDSRTNHQFNPFEDLATMVPATGHFLERILFCHVAGTKDVPDVTIFSHSNGHVWKINAGRVVSAAKTVEIESIHSSPSPLWVDPQHNLRVFEKFVFACQRLHPAYDDVEKYPHVSIKWVNGRYEIHHTNDAGEGGAVSVISASYV